MALISLYLVAFTIYTVYSGEPSIDLFDIESATKIAFYDFDKTLAIESFGGEILTICQAPPENNLCDGKDALVDTFLSLPDPTLRAKIAFGNDTRIARLKLHLDRVLRDDSTIEDGNIYVLSTSWEPVPKEYWADLIYEVFKSINLDEYFPRENILALDDPGVGIQADKGAVAKAKMDELGITQMNECIFADDKQGNLDFAEGICDTILIQERAGMDGTDMNYIEARTFIVKDTAIDVSDSDSSSDSGDQAISMGENSDNGKSVDNKYNIHTKVGLRNVIYIFLGVIGFILLLGVVYCCWSYRQKMKLVIERKERFVETDQEEDQNDNIGIQIEE